MANYATLKAAIEAVVKTNGNQEITGANLQSVLLAIVNSLGADYQFAGVATPSTDAGSPDQNVFYIGGAGTYANFGTTYTVPAGSVGVFKYDGSWNMTSVELFGDYIPFDGVSAVTIPDDLKSSYLLVDNAHSTITVSGYYSVYELYIKNYAHLCFIPYDGGNAAYKKLWLTATNGTVTEVSYPSNSCYTIDNSSGTYAYISFNARDGRTNLYTVGVTNISNAVSSIQSDVSYLGEIASVGTERLINVIHEKDIIYDTYITSTGRLASIAETASNRYYSVMFFPCKQYDRFIVSGNSTTSAYIKLYDAGLDEVGSYQGTNVVIDNSSHNVSYISFTSRSSESAIYLNTQTDVPITNATTMDAHMWQTIDLAWVDNKYINSSNELASISQTETYHYKAVHNYYVKEAQKIAWDLFFSGTARVVTSDIDGTIINTYTISDRVKEIDNSDGSIAFVSLSNNFVTSPNPIFRIYRVPLINEAVASLMNASDVTYPLAGKNVAVLGDSIMMLMAEGGISGGTVTYVGTDGVTYALSDLTNIGGLLYVTSTLVGGEVVSTTIQADVHNSNQEALDTESWIPLKEALNANYVINTGRGGATISGNTITTAYPAYGEQTFNTMPNHCLELKRRVDAGEPEPDVIMMWAGTNDVRKFVSGNSWVEPTNFDEIMALDYTTQLLANTDAAMDYKKTFYGALRFCLEYLYRNFQNALIVFFSPIPSVVSPRTYERERYVGSYIKKMAERYSALFVDACVEMGITDMFDTETSHRWLYDGLHPNTAGKVLFCNYTSKKLNEIFFLKD